MQVQIDKILAENILKSCWEKDAPQNFDDVIYEKLSCCFKHDHKTFRYILLNGILAKCTNPDANPLALQAGASIDGAFDARTLCHNVIVPFERKFMENRLGGSNEPFLNKPARFKTLDRGNAVRKGDDKAILFLIIDIFESDDFNQNPISFLEHLLCIIKSSKIKKIKFVGSDFDKNISSEFVRKTITELLKRPFEGTSLVFSVLLIMEINKISTDWNAVISSNHVNQSGSSQNEICDIDIKNLHGEFLFGIEVKDKSFTNMDVGHAISKVKASSASRLVIICRDFSQYHGRTSLNSIISEQLKEGFDLTVIDILTYSRGLISLKQNLPLKQVISNLNDHIEKMRPPKIFIDHLNFVFSLKET